MKRRDTPRRPGLDDPRYRANAATLRRTGAHICHLCGYSIDTQLPWRHPLSWSCDHRVPRSQLAPDDPRHWHPDYLLEAHRRCNTSRGAKALPEATPPPPTESSIEW